MLFCLPILAACELDQPAELSLPTVAPLASATPQQLLATTTVTPVLKTKPSVMVTGTPSPLPSSRLTILAVGDVMLGRMVNKTSVQQDDFTWPFQSTSDILSAGDLTLANLEAPLVPDCDLKGIGMRLCGDVRAVEGLTLAGFDVLSLANNHALDYDLPGRTATLGALRGAGIDGVYDGAPVEREIKGIRIGVLAYDDHDRDLDFERVRREAAALAQHVDLVIAILHWGYEYQPNPSARQQALAHALIDAGVDVIFGAHPHWLQPIENYHNGLIFYSLGNFVFDQTWSRQTRESMIVRLMVIRGSGGLNITYDLIPIEIEGYGQPQPIDQLALPTLSP